MPPTRGASCAPSPSSAGPAARHLDDGTTLEVTRTASDGTRNANSPLYGASWRAAKALG
ncbi:XF1762 family protein [Streptomyces sp. NPDC001833]|uniref:XF1762 family protein n=1 Tax=Streptomyces sp. NPDC001833 TaxID=3154658 RepID=UPI00331FB97E